MTVNHQPTTTCQNAYIIYPTLSPQFETPASPLITTTDAVENPQGRKMWSNWVTGQNNITIHVNQKTNYKSASCVQDSTRGIARGGPGAGGMAAPLNRRLSGFFADKNG